MRICVSSGVRRPSSVVRRRPTLDLRIYSNFACVIYKTIAKKMFLFWASIDSGRPTGLGVSGRAEIGISHVK